jgi:membrane associated rhomboid family serine protease
VNFDTPPAATLVIAAVCVSIFCLESYNYVGGEEFGAKSGAMIEEPWRFFTFAFTHDGVGHLFMNLLGLVLVGFLALELGIRGSVFLVIFLIVGFLTLMPLLLTACPYTFVGASAGVCGLFGAVAVRFRHYGFPSLFIFLLFFFALTVAPMAEASFGFSSSIIEAFTHSFGLVLGAGLAFAYESMVPLDTGKMGVKTGIPGTRRTR